MRTAHFKTHLLPLLLLLSLHSVSLCLASSCSFDGFMIRSGPKSIPTAPQQKTGNDWEPLRIVASTKDLEVASKYCLKNGVAVLKSSAAGSDADCTANLVTLTADQITTVKSILEKAIALHTDRLLVQRAVGPLKIPDLSKTEGCKHFNVPPEHRTNGVANADMVLYVASVSNKHGLKYSTALGVTCAKSAGGRPIAGAFLFEFDTIEISRHTVRLTAHHIAHALGFSYNEMKLRNMIVNKTVRGKTDPIALVKSDKTKEMTRAHYGCSTADSMELEDGENNNQKIFSHWERRNAKDELMATPIEETGTLFMGFYTALTMAVFEDMGYYKANFQMAEHMEYGDKMGCELFTEKCMKDGNTKWPNMFCADSESSARQNVCTTDRMGFGFCRLKDDNSLALPKEFQYFTSNDKKGGSAWSLTDYCPVVEQDPLFSCKSSEQQTRMPGSLFAKNSMCLDGSGITVKAGGQSVPVRAVCAEISCNGGSLRVKYLGDNTGKWYDCPEGQSLTPSSTSETFESGTIKCPKYKEVCTVAPDGSSLVPKVAYKPIEPSAGKSPSASGKPTGQTNDPNSGGKSKDGSSASFGLIPSVAVLVLSFAGCLIA